RGVAGFRIDCANRIVKDRELRDNPPVTPDMHPAAARLGQTPLYTTDRPEVHEVFRSWRRLCRDYDPERPLVGETWFFDGQRLPGQHRGRDPERTPMPWVAGSGAGFSEPDVEPWLPVGSDWRSVEEQRADPGSFLNFTRDLLARRRASPDLHGGAYRTLDSPPGVWRYRRGEATVVTLDFNRWE